MEKAEFPEKIFIKELLGLAVYEPKDPELQELKQLLQELIAGEHPRHEKLRWIYTAFFNFVLKLADNDEHYMMRLKTFWFYFSRWRPKPPVDWIKAWGDRSDDHRQG